MGRLSRFSILLLCASVAPIFAASCTALPTLNYAALQALGAGGCTLTISPGNDLLFNNFTFAGSATGTGILPVSTQMSFVLDNPGTSTGTGQSIYGFEFNPNLSVLGIGSADISIQYDITAPFAEITSIHLLETAAVTGPATAAVAEGPDCGKVTLTSGCVFLPTVTVTPLNPHQDLLGVGPFRSLHVFKDINVASLAGGTAAISNVRDSVDVSSTVPEPGTVALMLCGVGLFGIRRFGLKKRSL